MAYKIFYPSEDADDGSVYGTTFSIGNVLFLGRDDYNNDSFIKFNNVTIPNGAKILKSFIRFNCKTESPYVICNALIYFNDIGCAVAPTDITEYNDLALTAQSNSWADIQVMSANEYYDTVDIKTSLQEVINRSDWYSNGSVMAILKENGSTLGAMRRFAPYDEASDGLYKPELHVIYDTGDDLVIYDETDIIDSTNILFPVVKGNISNERLVHLWNDKDGERLNGLTNLKLSIANAQKTFSGSTDLGGQELVDEQWTETKSNGVTGTGIIDDGQTAFQAVGGSFTTPADYNALGDMPPQTARHIYLREDVPKDPNTDVNAFVNIAIEYETVPLAIYGKYFDMVIPASFLSENVTGVPIPVKLSQFSGTNFRNLSYIFGDIGVNYLKLMFTLDDGITPIHAEVVLWKAVTEEGWLYITPPLMAVNRDMTIRCYYDINAPDNTAYIHTAGSSQEVWLADYLSAWNFQQDPVGNPTDGIIDSTINSHHGTPIAFSSGALTPALFGSGIDFNGTTNVITVPDSNDWVFGDSELTISFTIKMDTYAIMNLMAQRDGVNDKQYGILNLGGNGNWQTTFFTSGSSTTPLSYSGVIPVSTWVTIDMVRAAGNVWSLYVDNVFYTSTITPVTIGEIDSPLYLGAYSPSSQGFNGIIDHIHVATAARSAAWRTLVYEGLNDNLITYGAIVTR